MDQYLDFNEYTARTCNSASTFNAVSRMTFLLKCQQKKVLSNSFINGQLIYCSVIWVLNSIRSNQKINKLHGRYLWFRKWLHHKYDDKLLSEPGLVNNHIKNTWKFITELFKISLRYISIHYEWDILGMLRNISCKMRNAWEHDISSQSSCIVDLKLWPLKYCSYGSNYQIKLISNVTIGFITTNKVRSSRPEVFLRKNFLKTCSNFTGEHLCQSVKSIKLLWNFIEIGLRNWCSPLHLLYIFRRPFPRKFSGRLLL